MADTTRLYKKIITMSNGRLKGFVLGEAMHGKRKVLADQVLFIRVGKPLIVPQLRKDSEYTYTLVLDGKRRIVKNLGIIGEKRLLTPEQIYFRAFRDAFFGREKKKLVEKPIIKREVIDNLRYWIGRASDDAPIGNYPFMEKFGSLTVNIVYKTPRQGLPGERWGTKRSEETLEPFFSPAFYDERDETGRHRILRWEDEVYDRAYYNLPFPEHLALKRVNVIIKNIIKHYHILAPEEPVVKARFNDVEGVNLQTRFVQEDDSEKIKYAAWDGGIVLTKKAAKKLSYTKRSEVLIFDTGEPTQVSKMLLVKPGTKVARYDKVLKEIDLPFWQKVIRYYPEVEQHCFETYCAARISGTMEVNKETNSAYIDSGERTVELGDKLVSRTGVKGVVALIVDSLPGGYEMVIGRTKLYSKTALVKELQESYKLTGKPMIFTFLRDKIAGDEYSVVTGQMPYAYSQVLSDNFREAMASHEDLMYYGQIFYLRTRYENAEINEMLRPTYFQIKRPFTEQLLGQEGVKLYVENGTGAKIKESTRKRGAQEITLSAKEQIAMFSWLPESQQEKITRLPRIDLERIEYLKNPTLVQQYQAMQKRGAVYVRYIDQIIELMTKKDGVIRKTMTNPVARYSYRGTLVARKLGNEVISIPAEAAQLLEIKDGALVFVTRDPIINYKSIGMFRVKIDSKLKLGTLALDPEVMFSYSADCDGDTMLVLPLKRKDDVLYYDFIGDKISKISSIFKLGKYRMSLLQKKGWTLVPVRKWLLEGTYGAAEDKARSHYDEVIEDPDKYKEAWKPGDHLRHLVDAGEKQYWSVQMVGYVRKFVISHIQHLGSEVVAPIEELYDVELGMDKAKLFGITGTPKVGWIALNTIYALVAGVQKKTFSGLRKEEVDSLKKIFKVKLLTSSEPYKIQILVDYPRGMSPATFGGVDIRGVQPSPVGAYFVRATMRNKERLNGIFNAFNSEDHSPYACMLHGNFRGIQMKAEPIYIPFEKATDAEIDADGYLSDFAEPTQSPEQDSEEGEDA